MKLKNNSSNIKEKSYSICAVPGCLNKSIDPKISMHAFPTRGKCKVTIADYFDNKQSVDKLDAWLQAVNLKEICKNDWVCSRHFTGNDFCVPAEHAGRKRLRKLSIPSLYLPGQGSSKTMEAKEKRIQRYQLKQNKKIIEKIGTDNDTLKKAELQDAKKICEELLENQNSSEPQYLHFEPEVNMVQEVYEADICASDESKCKFMEFLTSEKKLSTATGIENFDIFNTIVKCYVEVVGNRFEGHKTVMKTRDRVLLTFCMLKQNLCYSFLAIIFNSVSEQRCQRIFTETLVMLSKVLKGCIRWPSRDEIRKNIPLCFEDFEDTRIVLDCTEIFIQNPKEVCCQIIAYSYYKGNVTLKFMTGVTPAGDISFISKVYGGRTSDSKIFEQSELMTLLQPGDCIMVDRGFLIEELCQKNQWKCIKPPYLKGEKQFNTANAIRTPKVAKARVHVERSNQRIKAFEVLGSTMPSNLVPFAEDIMTVVCATVNLSSPILKDDKFFPTNVQE